MTGENDTKVSSILIESSQILKDSCFLARVTIRGSVGNKLICAPSCSLGTKAVITGALRSPLWFGNGPVLERLGESVKGNAVIDPKVFLYPICLREDCSPIPLRHALSELWYEVIFQSLVCEELNRRSPIASLVNLGLVLF